MRIIFKVCWCCLPTSSSAVAERPREGYSKRHSRAGRV